LYPAARPYEPNSRRAYIAPARPCERNSRPPSSRPARSALSVTESSPTSWRRRRGPTGSPPRAQRPRVSWSPCWCAAPPAAFMRRLSPPRAARLQHQRTAPVVSCSFFSSVFHNFFHLSMHAADDAPLTAPRLLFSLSICAYCWCCAILYFCTRAAADARYKKLRRPRALWHHLPPAWTRA
jgi:hypothetical protein